MKTILITGCSSGFGYEATKYLAEKGHHVIATMRNVSSKNAKSASELKEFGNIKNLKIDVLEIDVTSDESVKSAGQQLPVIDVLINNAGMGFGGSIEAFSSEQVLAQLDLNIVGTIRMVKTVLSGMRAQKSGLIIQVSSVAGRGGFPGFGVYNASKFGLEGLSEALRYEVAPHGIDVAIVEPGPFNTRFLENVIDADNAEIAAAYQHVTDFFTGFAQNMQDLYTQPDVPTDPIIIVKIFEDLINAKAGTRPLRVIGGLDFGFGKLNELYEPIRKSNLENMGIAGLDGAVV